MWKRKKPTQRIYTQEEAALHDLMKVRKELERQVGPGFRWSNIFGFSLNKKRTPFTLDG
ncbi:hypothetical protein ACUY3L_08925 [Corynebacterium mastitidis]